mgnify:CR=1 FL=1
MEPFKILLIDGDYLMHRCLYSSGMKNLSYKVYGEEFPTGILKGVFSSLHNYIKDFSPDIVYFCMTGGKCTFRKEIYPGYKEKDSDSTSTFNEVPEGEMFSNADMLFKQDSVLREILPDFGIRIASCPGYEADDCALYLSYLYQNDPQNYQTILLTDDWDYAQAMEFGAHLFRPMKGQYLTPENFKEEVGIDKKLFIFEKALLGDASDKIPKAGPGIGPKKARDLIVKVAESGVTVSVDSIVDEGKKYLSEKLHNGLVETREDLRRNMNLMAMNSTVLKNLYPYLAPLMKHEHSFDYNKSSVHARKYGLKSLSQILIHPMMAKLK